MRILFVFTLIFSLAFLPSASVHARSEGIALVVNDDIISRSDVEDRMGLVIASSGLPNTRDIQNKVLPQVLGALVDEQIMLQEAESLDLEVSAPEIAQGFATIAAQNNFEAAQFEEMLTRGGINLATMRAQIKAQIAWSKVIQTKLKPKVIVSDNDIDARMEQIASGKGKSEYLVSEIFLPVDHPKNEAAARQLAGELLQEIRSGKAPFAKIAAQFSKAAGSTQGGDLGWIQQGQLPRELDNALETLQAGNVSNPIRSLSGFHLVQLRDKRVISDETVPTREQLMSAIGLERLQRLQQRHLLDLKSAAFIDNRLDARP